MPSTPDLHWLAATALLTALLWVPHVMESFVSRGIWPTLGNPSAADPLPPPWADRARRAHRNAVDNLTAFAPLVLSAAMLGVTNATTLLATQIYFFARLGHYLVYVAGIPVIRTIMFLVGIGAMIAVALPVFAA